MSKIQVERERTKLETAEVRREELRCCFICGAKWNGPVHTDKYNVQEAAHNDGHNPQQNTSELCEHETWRVYRHILMMKEEDNAHI